MIPGREDLASALDDAGGLRLLRIGHLERSKIYVTADWQGQPLEFVASITDVMHAQTPDNPRSRARDILPGGQLRERLKARTHWDEAALRAEGLPLYLDEHWLRGALGRLGSYAEIERVYGYPETTLATAGKRHGIKMKPRLDSKTKEQARALLGEGKTPGQVARKLGISKPTVQRMLK